MAKKYLDDAGLTYFWGKAKAYFLGGTSPDDVADTTNCPKMDGTKTYGTSHILAREDHIHPTDTSRAPLASPDFTGTPTAPTPASSTDSTQIATTAFVHDLVDNIQQDAGGCWYGTSGTAASTSSKVVTCSGFSLKTGAIIAIMFSQANTAGQPTLNVNSTGGKGILVGGSTPSSTYNVLKWSQNTLVFFMYDSTEYNGNGGYHYLGAAASAGSSQPRGANTWYGECSTSASTAAKTATIDNFVLTKGAVVIMQMSAANSADALTLNVNSTDAKDVYWKGAATSSSNKLTWENGEIVIFVYDGTRYRAFKDVDTNTTYSDATTSASGLMSATDKTKLDSITLTNNVIDSSCLPSYVDDVIEAYPRTGQTELGSTWLSATSGGSALTPETGKIYVLMGNSTNYSTNDTFRWSGSAYVKLADGGASSITTSEIDTIMAS